VARTSSAVPGRDPVQDQQDSFSGGLNTTSDESALGKNEIRRADNARLPVEGGITKRLGTQRTSAAAIVAATPVRGGYSWRKPSSAEELVVCDGKLYTGAFSIGMAWTNKAGALAAGVVPSFAGFIAGAATEVAYIADGGLLNKYDGAALSVNLAGTPSVSRIAVYNQRLYGISGKDQSIYGSALNDGDSLGIDASGGFEAIVRTFGDQRLTAIATVKNSLLMWHVSGISRFTGITQDDLDIQAGAQGVTSDVGTIAPDSIVVISDQQLGIDAALFVTDRGVYEAHESGILPVSNPIRSVLASLSQADFARVAAAHNRRYFEVLFYIPDVGVYVYNYVLKAWAGPFTGGYKGVITHSMWESQDGEARPIVLVGKADGFVERIDAPGIYRDRVNSDGSGGDLFTFAVRCRRMYGKDFTTEKSWGKWAYILATNPSTTATLRYSTSRGTGISPLGGTGPADPWGAGTWGAGTWGGGVSDPRRVPVAGRGGWIDLTIVDDGESESLYSGVMVEGTALGRRGS
jgi:hypothetical protein